MSDEKFSFNQTAINDIHHNIKNPLTIINASVDSLDFDRADKTLLEKRKHLIKTQVTRIVTYLDSLQAGTEYTKTIGRGVS
jgi:hypothetical protein